MAKHANQPNSSHLSLDTSLALRANLPLGRSNRWRWEKLPASRYYEAWVDHDLFGDVLIRVWGRIGSGRGGGTAEPITALCQQLDELLKRRAQRGYALV